MATDFKRGDHVEWNSEAGRVRRTTQKKVTREITFKGYKRHASKEEPQYIIKSDKTDHLAIHKGSALKKIKKSSRWLRSLLTGRSLIPSRSSSPPRRLDRVGGIGPIPLHIARWPANGRDVPPGPARAPRGRVLSPRHLQRH